ncbi:hypothetical protein [Micromonospora nigra]|uniref:hypothetical protein n=1 Tax=Micromonospora nigra TaxID=145857 RepID=UPI001586F83E|nr:hypothetical protein [Micromonospora nigra]
MAPAFVCTSVTTQPAGGCVTEHMYMPFRRSLVIRKNRYGPQMAPAFLCTSVTTQPAGGCVTEHMYMPFRRSLVIRKNRYGPQMAPAFVWTSVTSHPAGTDEVEHMVVLAAWAGLAAVRDTPKLAATSATASNDR